jgi:hypothetical protein
MQYLSQMRLTSSKGFQDFSAPLRTVTSEPGKTLWDWLSLLGVPLSLAGLGYGLQQQQQKRAETLSKEQREIAADEAKEEVLQAYIDRLSSLLVDKNVLEIASKVHNPLPAANRITTSAGTGQLTVDGCRKALSGIHFMNSSGKRLQFLLNKASGDLSPL